MPHKHKRRNKDESTYDLPPTVIAKPLPAREPQQGKDKNGSGKAKKRSRSQPDGLDDDTPRAFVQLMQFQKKLAAISGDKKKENDKDKDSERNSSSKKRKREEPNSSAQRSKVSRPKTAAPKTTVESPSASNAVPKILPGERLFDFATRVNQALPLSGISKRSSHKSTLGSHNLPAFRDHRLTKHEKHLQRMQQQWREEEARIREREAEEQEEKEAEHEEQLEVWKEWDREAGKDKVKGRKKKKKGKKREGPNDNQDNDDDDDDDGNDNDGDDDDDPWAKLNERARAKRPINPFEVAQAPPQLIKPKEVFKVRGTGGAKVNVANVPAAAGSLRRREELAEERKSIVEEYRRLMAQNRQR
ncbi:hypothetical protein Egran_02101 [Elaphomyces granulatus]|uniref:Urease accessory protein UreD n=1 Tax=Elaphomyces granulatus TaxID=519963 RepID=A0A232M1D9_9EURO|nr:hypothetical protein Egran_02101 [Elaphomyces granulatus]